MKTAYVITSGRYSDYSINSVFSTRDKAEKFIADNPNQGRYDKLEIEEWEIDELEGHTPKTVWFCNLTKSTGDVTRTWEGEQSCSKRYTEIGSNQYNVWAHSSVSAEHAQKLAIEKRQEYLRGLHF